MKTYYQGKLFSSLKVADVSDEVGPHLCERLKGLVDGITLANYSDDGELVVDGNAYRHCSAARVYVQSKSDGLTRYSDFAHFLEKLLAPYTILGYMAPPLEMELHYNGVSPRSMLLCYVFLKEFPDGRPDIQGDLVGDGIEVMKEKS